MRILMVSKACLVGSYQTKLEAIAAHDDVELTVIVPPTWLDPAGEVRLERSHTAGYQLLVDPIRFNGHYHLHYYPKLSERLEALRPHILHMDEEPYNVATWRAVRQANASGIKSLFFSWQNIRRNYPWPFSRIERQVLRKVDYAITGNEDSAAIWSAKGYQGPIKVIPQFGIDPDLFRPPSNRDSGRAFVIGSAGRRLVPEKGVDLLLKAAADLPGIWRLHVAGEGPERLALQQLAAQLGIADRIHFDGVIPSDQMAAYLAQLDVMIMPSRTLPNWKEQFGRALIEAMACGVVVIGSDSGEIPNVIGDAGLIFPEENVPALHDRLLMTMSDAATRDSLSEAGRQRVLANYTQQRVADQTVGVYREMLTGE
jgi:glycosyltransferase involved in cell wall biosynthesis